MLVVATMLFLTVLRHTSGEIPYPGDLDNQVDLGPRTGRDVASHRFAAQAVKQRDNTQSHSIVIVGNHFVVDGQRLHIKSGSVHYFRLPAEYWPDRLQKLKAAGLNAVTTYVEWSYHEPEERQYNFDGDRNLASFISQAQALGLYVLLRPGPYICAERDLGGFPYWLLSKYPNIKLRTSDKDFLRETKIWIEKLFLHIKPLLYGNGGPIILVQVENEYGSYDFDMPYKEQIRDIIGGQVGVNALLYTSDGPSLSNIVGGGVPGALSAINFGPESQVPRVFANLRHYMPEGPLMNAEYYPGWLTHWTESFQGKETALVTRTLSEMMNYGVNFNFYMFYGGTNYEFSAGANYDEGLHMYQPDITSYDYDAPISEAGDPTPKYFAIRNVLEQFNSSLAKVPLPEASPKGDYGKITLNKTLALLSRDGRASLGKVYQTVNGSVLPTFESLCQRAGLMLYETKFKIPVEEGQLEIKRPRDRIYVFVDGVYRGLMSRMTKSHNVTVSAKAGSVLSLLVETQGRINFGRRLHDFKGILSPVTLKGAVLEGPWNITGYPLVGSLPASPFPADATQGPQLFNGVLTLPNGSAALDTFVDTSNWGKGYIWVNGHNLGRYWPSAGPQVTLYLPGAWLSAEPEGNTVTILELEKPAPDLTINFIDHPILDGLKKVKT